MNSSWPSRIRSLGLGLAAVVCGTALRLLLYPVLGPLAPGVAFIPFVIGAAWFGGTAAGSVAAVVGYLVARYLFNITAPMAGPLSEGLRALLFLLAGWGISWLTHSLRAAKIRAERERRHAATILASVSDGLIGLDPEFRLTYLNATAETLLGCTRGDLLAEPLRTKVGPAMQQRAKLSFEYRDQRSGGWFDVHVYPDEQGGLSILLRDIAERKEAEHAMAEANRALERSNSELQQFAYVAAHDLREPLRNLMTYNELISRKFGEALGEEGRELLDNTVQGARRMRDLVDDLLVYCQAVGQGEGAFAAAVDCDAVLSFLLANFSPLLAECNGKVSWGTLPSLYASESQVMQLFQNLVGNALKYRSERPPEVHISAARRDEEWIFSIKDNGIGIAPQYREEIFGLFRRLHAPDIPGTGLGLAICKRIVDHYGGRIWVEAEEGNGSTFFFSFPESKVQESAGPEAAGSTRTAHAKA
jgi:signal transduction histidine kinase